MHININNLIAKKDAIRSIVNKTKTAIIAIKKIKTGPHYTQFRSKSSRICYYPNRNGGGVLQHKKSALQRNCKSCFQHSFTKFETDYYGILLQTFKPS